MLILPIKAGVTVDLSSALGRWLDDPTITVTANVLDFVLPKPALSSTAIDKELSRLQSLRNCVTSVLLKKNSHKHALAENGLADVYEYHAVLLAFEQRGFPTKDAAYLDLPWRNALDSTTIIESHSHLGWERAVVLYNAAALLSQCGDEPTTTRESIKQNVASYQQAASIINVLRKLVDTDWNCVELSDSFLEFWQAYFLASAQQTICQLVDSPGTKAKLEKSAHELWNETLRAANNPRLLSEELAYGSVCLTASKQASVLAHYHMALQYRTDAQWGLEIAELRVAATQVQGMAELRSITAEIADRLEEAVADNNKLYHDDIPATPPVIEAKQLAKLVDLPADMVTPKVALFQ